MEPVDLRPTSRFPSAVEIAGVVFGLLPFAVSTATMSSHTVNGDTTVHYRDWTAVGGGAAAGVCGVAALALLVRTDPAKRLVRVAAGCVLLALAALQILRGFGVIGVSQPATTTSTWERTEIVQDQRMETPVDLEGPTRQLFGAWREGRLREIYDAAHPRFRESVPMTFITELYESTTESFGKLEKLGDKLATKHEMATTFTVTGKAVYATTTVDITVQFQVVDGKPLLTHLRFDLPKDLSEGKPADADRVARRFLDAMLAGKLDKSLLHPDVLANIGADFDDELRKLLAKIGKVKTIGEPKATVCAIADRCVEIAIVGTKARAVLEVALLYRITRWRVREFNLKLGEQ